MAYEFTCVWCNELLSVHEESIGCAVECPECGETVIVPGYEDAPGPDLSSGFEPGPSGITCPACDSPDVFAETQSFGRKAAGHFGGAIVGGVVASVFGVPARMGSDFGSMVSTSRAYVCNDCGHEWSMVI